MQANDATIALVNWPQAPTRVLDGLTLDRLGPRDALHVGPEHFMGFEGVPNSQVAAHRLFTKAGRFFQLIAVFGNANPSAGRLRDVNAILGSLQIGPDAAKQANGVGELVKSVPPPGVAAR